MGEPPLPSMLFVFEGDEIKVIRRDMLLTESAPARPDTPAMESEGEVDVSDIDCTPTATPISPVLNNLSAFPFPSPPTRALPPPPPPPRDVPTSPPQSIYLKRREVPRDSLLSNSSIDIEAMIERSDSPVGDPYAPSEDEFESLHSEFMGRIMLSGQLAVNAINESSTRTVDSRSPDQPHTPVTPQVTQPLNIRKKETPDKENEGSDASPKKAKHNDRHDRREPHDRFTNMHNTRNNGTETIGARKRASARKSKDDDERERERDRNPSPSPPLLRTPETPPATTLPSPNPRFFIKVPSAPNIHERRATRREMARTSRRSEKEKEKEKEGRPPPAIIIPPLEVPVPAIALGPLPPLPTARSRAPLSATWSSGSVSPPSSAAANSAALSHLIFQSGSSDDGSSRSSRRPMSMQPSPSPREFGMDARARMLGLAPSRPVSEVTYNFGGISIPASSPVVHAFEDIGALRLYDTLSAPFPFNPSSSFTQPRPAPRVPAFQPYRLPSPPAECEKQAEPLSPVTPTKATAERSAAIPPKARALLGIFAQPSAEKKSSAFTKVSGLVRLRNTEEPREARRDKYAGHRVSVIDEDPGLHRGLHRVASTESVWNDPENFAPLSGLAQAKVRKGEDMSISPPYVPYVPPSNALNVHNVHAHGSSVLGSSIHGSTVHTVNMSVHSNVHHSTVYNVPSAPPSSPFAFVPPGHAPSHAHKGSFSSTHSFPLSVAESAYPSSVLSKKSSFEVPRSSPKVFASPKAHAHSHGSSYKSSIDGEWGSHSTTPHGSPHKSKSTTPHGSPHKSKTSLDGIPNLTPNSGVGIHSPPPMNTLFKGKAFHTPSLSPITYSPPPQHSLLLGPPRTSSLAATPMARSSSESMPRNHRSPPSRPSTGHKASGSTGSMVSGEMHELAGRIERLGVEVTEGRSERGSIDKSDRFPHHAPTNLHLRHSPSSSLSRSRTHDESFFEPDTPVPQRHFKGLRNAVKGHWENRI